MANSSSGSSGSTTNPTQMAQLMAAMSGAGSPMYNETHTNTTYLTQTSQPDITGLINSVMQQLVGRNATANEIANYGAELLAAERANTGSYSGVTSYGPSGKRNVVSGTQTTTGIDPTAFLTTLIQGTADAKSYRAATQYFDGMIQALQEMKTA